MSGVGGVGDSQVPQEPSGVESWQSWQQDLGSVETDLGRLIVDIKEGLPVNFRIAGIQSWLGYASTNIKKLSNPPPGLISEFNAFQSKLTSLLSEVKSSSNPSSYIHDIENIQEHCLHIEYGRPFTAQQQLMLHALATLETIILEAGEEKQNTVSLSQLSSVFQELSRIGSNSGMPASIRNAAENLIAQLKEGATSKGVSLSLLTDVQATLKRMLPAVENQ